MIENIRTFALPFESQTYTFKMEYEYDPFNRIQSILYPDSELVEYSYNLGGMLSKVTGSVTRKVTDLVGPMQMHGGSLLPGGDELMGGGAVSGDISGNDPFFIPTETIRYSYIDSIVYNKFELKDSVVYGNGTRVRYVYDSLQRLTALRSYTADDELMQDIAYHYDSVGNILDIENSAAALGNGLGGTYRQEYTYDNFYRLTHATGWWECRPDHLTLRDTVDMRYSKNGRIIRKRMSAETLKNMQLNLVRYDRQYQYPSVYSNKVNRVTDAISGTSHQFEWESGGNLMRHANPDQNYDRRLWWTEDNRLQFVKDNGSTGAYYQYDAGGDRTYKLLYHKTTGSLNGVQTDYYTLDDATLYVSPYLVVTPQGYTKHYYAETERITTQLGKYRFAVVDSCVAGDSLAPIKLQNAAQAFPTDSFPTPTPMFGYLHSLVSKPKAVSTLYFYHPDHLGSASWITNIYGRTIQHLYYLPWGEDFVNQRTGSFSSMYTFSAKEKDAETGYSYFGARYYSSDLSIWLSVDPMSDKYPSLSPYVYCANNPVKLVDPNGDTVIAYDHFSKKMIRSYLKEIFGKNNLFRFSGYTLTINERHYEQYYQDASTDRQKLLDGFQDIITRSEKVIVKIVENTPSFVFEKSEAIRDENGVVIGGRLTGEFTSLPNKGGGASLWGKRFSSYLLGVDNSVRDNLSTDDGGLTGNPAATFTHELLDEVLNHYIYKRDNANSSKLDGVAFQNAALRTMNCKQRNGEDHE